MKPANPSRTSRKAAQGRARLKLKRHLGWTAGFPVPGASEQLAWLVPDAVGRTGLRPVTIGRQELGRAQRTANELQRDFPGVLPKLVGDPDAWRERVDRVLALVKPAVHSQHPLPADLFAIEGVHDRQASALARETLRAWTSLGPTVAALSWAHAVDQTDLAPALRWVALHAEALDRIVRLLSREAATELLHVLVRLAGRVGSPEVTPLLQWLSDERVHRTPTSGADEHSAALLAAVRRKKIKRKPYPAERPAAEAIEPLTRWTFWLGAQDPRIARRALRLFQRTAPQSLLDDWQRWWCDLDEAVRPVAKRLQVKGDAPEQALSDAAAGLVSLRGRVPPPLMLGKYLSRLQSESGPLAERRYRAYVATLDALPDTLAPLARTWFFMHWAALAAESREYGSRLLHLLSSFRTYLHGVDAPADVILKPWSKIINRTDGGASEVYGVDDEILEELESRAAIAGFFEALRSANADLKPGVDDDAADNLVALVKHAADPRKAAAMFLQLHERRLHAEHLYGLWEPSVRMTADDITQYGGVLAELKRLRDDHDMDFGKGFLLLVQAFSDVGCLDLLRRTLLGGGGHRIRLASHRWAMLRAVGAHRGLSPRVQRRSGRPPGWVREYPQALRGRIRELIAVHPEAEKAVASVLGKDFPRRAELQRELSALERKASDSGGGDPRIQTRIANLRRRLSTDPRVSEARMGKLESKLAHLTDHAAFAAWERQLEERMAHAVPEFLGVQEAPEWSRDPRHLALFPAIANLRSSSHALALRLLRARSGVKPWDLREAAPNQRFIRRLEGRGTRMGPWVDGLGPRTYGDGAHALTLELEDDPLEVFHMGGHFNTCLSPDSFNFFSVISNAADINKRVLYGRDPEGRVQGRCLLALTDEGGIVTFHAYSHDPKKNFIQHVRQFVTELAREMHVVPVPGGSISTLVATEWYDDGPADLVGRFDFLKDGSPLRAKLQSVREEEFLDLVKGAFAPLDLNELTLPLILGLPELQSRPELVRRLLPTIRALPSVSIDVLAMLARALTAHGHTAVAVDFFGPFAKDYLLQTHRRVNWLDPLVMDLLLARSPSDLLDVLRKTRRKGVRGWPTETDGERLFSGAEAYRALNRRNKALELYQRAIDAHASKETKATAKQRIVELADGFAVEMRTAI